MCRGFESLLRYQLETLEIKQKSLTEGLGKRLYLQCKLLLHNSLVFQSLQLSDG